ncbi:MAG: hypothetical protein N2B58_03935 [Desulfobacterales bacterium]
MRSPIAGDNPTLVSESDCLQATKAKISPMTRKKYLNFMFLTG